MRRAAVVLVLSLLALSAQAQTTSVTVTGDGALSIVSAGTQGPAGASASTAGLLVNVKSYGAVGNGTTDDSTAVLQALAAVQVAGGTLYFPFGIYRIDSQLALTNNGSTPPRQYPVRITGDGATMSGEGGGVFGGTILDLRYSGTNGKLLTLGLGLLEITGVTFTDSTGGTLPFLYTTNTTLHVHDSAFIGTKFGTACNQDAIILGGTSDHYATGAPDDRFQGYGTVIRDNYFDHIRRMVYLHGSANALQINDNTVWTNSGSNLAGGAAIDLEGMASPVDYSVGNVVTGNLIEVGNYVYGVKCAYAVRNAFIANTFFDSTATTTAAFRFESTATNNLVIAGFEDGTLTTMSDAAGSNKLLTSAQGVWSQWPLIDDVAKQLNLVDSTGKHNLQLVTGNALFRDDTPTTGITSVGIRAGANQGTGNLLTLYNAAGTPVWTVNTTQTVLDQIFANTVYGRSNAWMIYDSNYYVTSAKAVQFTNGTGMWDAVDVGFRRNAAGKLEVDSGVAGTFRDLRLRSLQLATDTRPTCDLSARGSFWFVAGGAGVKDKVEVCAKDAGDAYDWRVIY